jgi:hypothetical protein
MIELISGMMSMVCPVGLLGCFTSLNALLTGFKMNTIKHSVYEEALVDTVKEEARITEACCLQTFDHLRVSPVALDFKTKFTLRVTRDATLHAFLGYFDIGFETTPEDKDARPVTFTTGPHGIETHWKQTIFLLKDPITVKKGKYKYASFGNVL